MNRQQRRAAPRPPRQPMSWDVTLLELPDGAKPLPFDAFLLIVERDQLRDVLQVTAGTALGSYVRRAARISTFGQSARLPDRIRCADPALAARLRGDLTDVGVRIEVVPSLPVAEALAEAMRKTLDVPPPGPDGDLPRWREIVAELGRVAPWTVFDPSMGFALEDGPLAGGFLAVHGGPTRAAILLFAGTHDWQDYWRVTVQGAAPRFSAIAIWIVPPEEVTAEEARKNAELGLTLPDGRVPVFAAMDAGVSRPVNAFEARRLLAAAEIVLAGCALGVDAHVSRTHLPAMPTNLGPQDAIFCGLPPDVVVDEQHLCLFTGLPRPDGTEPTGIVLQLAPPAARRVADQLRGADAAIFRDLRGDLGVVLLRGAVEIGLVAVVPAEWAASIREVAAETGRVDLAVSRAGVDAPSTRMADLTLTLPLRVVTGPPAAQREPDHQAA